MGNTAKSLAELLDSGLTEQMRIVQDIAGLNSVIAAAGKVAKEGVKNSQAEIAATERELRKFKDTAGDNYANVYLMDKKGVCFVDATGGLLRGFDLVDRDYFKQAIKGNPSIGSVIVSKRTGHMVAVVSYPIWSPETRDVIGVVGISIELKYLMDKIGLVKIGKTGYAFLVDQNGIYIAHPVKENILKSGVSQIKGMESVLIKSKRGEIGAIEYLLDSTLKFAAFAPVSISGWTVFNSVPVHELYAPARFTRNVIVAIGILSLLLVSIIFYFFARSITRPMIHLVGAAEKIADGDLMVEVTSTERQDEIGSLARAFTLMIQSLKEKAQIAEKIAASDLTVKVTTLSDTDTLGNAFATMVEKLRGQIHQIIEGVNVLASAGSEIMASVSQLTSGAAETATSVSETTTTVEEVKQTADVTNQKARHVSELGQRTLEISRTGLKSIEDTVNGMNRIREQMESIADMVVRLSEQSQAIGEIIATVNDIAEQSNLLAVNASIEAAKAGEQGKGFAVVAQEIRSLAAQSKQATTQVRNILFDVQKAIGSAVMATEQGNKAVEEGVKLSTQAGESIDILAESVTEATNAAIQIAASSQQQLIGMDQVVSAMENIRESSIQMASSTKQTEKAAHDLHNLGQRLQEIVKLYKV